MKKLIGLILLIVLASSVEAQVATGAGVALCKNPTGNRIPVTCNAAGDLNSAAAYNTKRVCVAITPDTAAFAASDIVGPSGGASGLLTFPNAFRAGINSGLLQNVQVTNTEIDGIAFSLCLFTDNPAASTVASNGPLTVPAADLQKWLGCYSISAGVALVTTEMYSASGLGVAIEAANTSFYAVLRTTAAPTWAAAQTVNVCADILQD